jgi:NitT/TauT family transport system substrate-binding protein
MEKLRRATLCLSVLMGVAALAGQVTAAEKVRLILDWAPIAPHAWAYLAEDKGWFKEAGLEVELLEAKGGTAAVQQVAAGQGDVAWAQLAAMAIGRANGMPITSVACLQRTGDTGFLVPKGAGYKSAKDLEGKRIGYAASGGAGPYLDAFLRASGTSRDKFTVINVDTSSLATIYTSGSVDAILSTVAYLVPIVEKTRPSEGLLFGDVGLVLPGYGLIVGDRTVQSREAMLKGLVAATEKAWQYILEQHEHGDEAIEIMLKRRPNERLDAEIMKGQLEIYKLTFNKPKATDHPIGWQSEEDWAGTIKAMEGVGVLKPGSKPSEYFTNRFVAG